MHLIRFAKENPESMTTKLSRIKTWSCSLLVGALSAAIATPSLAKTAAPISSNEVGQQNVLLAQASIYQTARQELPEDWYLLYRIVDRIARANQLDDLPWRLVVMPEYDLNAFATQNNLIAVYEGLIDQVAGDSAAIACVVGHEMAHHTARHVAVSNAEQTQLTAEIEAKAREEIEAEIKDAKSDAQGSRIGAGILDAVGIRIGSGTLRNGANRREAEAEERVQEILAERQAELQAKLLEQNRANEFEADTLGYRYVARAGFDTEGCLRTMRVLARSQRAEFDTTHPAVTRRIEALETMMREEPATELKAQGSRHLANSQPLTYDLSKDNTSLRVNSSRGGSAADDFDRTFGQ